MIDSTILFELGTAATVAFLSYRLRALTLSGAIAASIIGSIVFTIGGWSASIVLMVFFIGGSLLSRLPRNLVKHTETTARDWKQVGANGLVPSLALVLQAFRPDLREWTSLLYLGSFASMLADTSATEIGTRFGGTPISIATGRRVQSGASGGITGIGLVASLAGSFLIVVAFGASHNLGSLCEMNGTNWILPVLGAGFFGALIDSWLGATVQAIYRCIVCSAVVEVPVHCGADAVKLTGLWIIDNSGVNLIASAVGGIAAVSFAGLLN